MAQEMTAISHKFLGFVSILLFLAIAPMPYGFYTFIKIIVCGCAGAIFYQLWDKGYRGIWLWVWGMIVILFNPVAEIHMTKEVWMVVDALAGSLFGYAAWVKFNHKV